MSTQTFFTADQILELNDKEPERIGNEAGLIDPSISTRCPTTGFEVTLSQSHYSGTYTINVGIPRQGYTSFSIGDHALANIDDKTVGINRAIGIVMSGVAVQHQKLDAKTAAWAVEDKDKKTEAAADIAQYTAYFKFQGFDPGVAKTIAQTAAQHKWAGSGLDASIGTDASVDEILQAVWEMEDAGEVEPGAYKFDCVAMTAERQQFYKAQGHALEIATALAEAEVDGNEARVQQLLAGVPPADIIDPQGDYDRFARLLRSEGVPEEAAQSLAYAIARAKEDASKPGQSGIPPRIGGMG